MCIGHDITVALIFLCNRILYIRRRRSLPTDANLQLFHVDLPSHFSRWLETSNGNISVFCLTKYSLELEPETKSDLMYWGPFIHKV